jgi:hypothetical protein
MRLSRLLTTPLCGMLAALAACHDSTSPTIPTVEFSASQALAKVEPVVAVFDLPLFASFEGGLSYFEPLFRSAPFPTLALAPNHGWFDLRAMHALAPVAKLRASAIPPEQLGKTLVWNFELHRYVVDPTLAGAPATGARFLLYLWDAPNGQPQAPLVRVGYVDIDDVSEDASSELTEIVVERDAPRLIAADFVVMHATNADVNVFGIQGSATNGFAVALVDLSGTENGGDGNHHLAYNITLSSSPAGVSAFEQLTFDQATASQSGKLELNYSNHKLTDESVPTGAEVKYDGSLYARVLFPTTPQDTTSYLRADGTALSQQEIVDLNTLLDRVVVANFFWINLAFP